MYLILPTEKLVFTASDEVEKCSVGIGWQITKIVWPFIKKVSCVMHC